MTKRRVYELAKDYGMKGPEFVEVLHNLGFEKVKTHMAVIDDADQMVLEVRLGAAGYAKSASSTASAAKAAPIRKKSPIRKKAIAKKDDSDSSTAIAEQETAPSPIRKKSLTRLESEPTTEATAPKPASAPIRKKPTLTPKPAEAAVETPVVVPTAADTPTAETPVVEKTEVPDAPPSKDAADKPSAKPVTPAEPVVDAKTESEKTRADETQKESAKTAPAAPLPRRTEPEQTPASAKPVEAKPEAPTPAPTEKETRVAPAAAARKPAPLERTQPAPSAASGTTPAPTPAAPTDERKIRRLPQPEKKAKILGRIELPAATIRDATRRSAGGPRNPAGVAQNLRQAAMNQFRNRGAQKGPFGGFRRGPGGGQGGRFGGGGGRGRGGSRRPVDPLAPPPGIDPNKVVQVEAPVSVKKLSEGLGHKVNQILLVLMRLGVPANINSYLDKDQIELLALELSRAVEVVEETGAEDALVAQLAEEKESTTDEDMRTRPPIVTFMGHVDHGKTTLIDALRGSDITKGEAGGITQHVGAYRVKRAGHELVILDTPGHAAFTQMRARGAQLTDVVVLVVAADDGVMPQTEEALAHARAAEVPLLIAVNKSDKPEANPMLVRQQLSAKGVQPEEWGGDVQFVDCSALTGAGLDELAEKIALEAEILELKANPEHLASGVVIEAKQTPAQGNVISLMVLDGTLELGDLVLCGSGTGRIRVLLDDHGNPIEVAVPGTPVEVLGLPELPSPGDKFFEVTDTKMAKEVASQRATKQRNYALAEKSKSRGMDLKAQLLAAKRAEVKMIIKADVMGSLEPIKSSLEELSNDEVGIRILHAALGGITETDVTLADASEAIIVGFNSVPDEKARKQADATGVQIRFYNIIYELLDDARKLLEGLLSPEEKEEVRGHAEIRRVFRSSKLGNISGCMVTDGTIGRNNSARLIRDGKVIYSGKIKSLRREKDDTREVRTNFECGILLQNYDDVKEGDIIEAYEIIELKRTLGDA